MAGAGDNGTLMLLLALHFALTALPGVAGVLHAARLGVRQPPVLLAIGLAVSGLVAIVSFWAYYTDPLVGQTWTYFVLFGSVALTMWSLWGGHLYGDLLRQLATPLGLWGLGCIFLLFFGFLHGGNDASLDMAGNRFFGPLPGDNAVPFIYSEWFFRHGHAGDAPILPGEWLSSDRPPLQVGYVLSQRQFEWAGSELDYQVHGVILQQLWIVGLWALLLAARVGRTTRALAVLAVLVSDLAIVNGFFVWPKMLPAALLLAAAALVLTPLWLEVRRDPRVGCLVGALFGLAMLAHGSSVFAIVPLAIIAAVRGLPGWRWLAAGLCAGIVAMAPWAAYQKYGDPPGNRLTKWMLAGVTEVDNRTTSEAIVDSYREVGLWGALQNKADNFETMVGGEPFFDTSVDAANALGSGDLEGGVRGVRSIIFFHLLPSLGLLIVAPLAMLAGRRRRSEHPAEWRLALTFFLVVGLGCLFWGLALFGNAPSRTSIHVGSLALPALALCGCVVGLRATFPRLTAYVVGAGVLLSLLVYAPSFEPVQDSAYSPLAALLAGLALAAFAVLAFRPPASESRAEPSGAAG